VSDMTFAILICAILGLIVVIVMDIICDLDHTIIKEQKKQKKGEQIKCKQKQRKKSCTKMVTTSQE
jgi:hypothetical protein